MYFYPCEPKFIILTKDKKNYAFIDNIRGISMIAIVMEHCSLFWGIHYKNLSDQIIQSIALQTLKPGTIIFFILAGFLIGDKFNTYNTIEYLKRRINNTIKPWLFWIGILLFLNFIQGFLRYTKGKIPNFFDTPIVDFFQQLNHIVFFTSFWFILNFLICIFILLLFRKYIYKLKFGLLLLCLSLFYSVNVYFLWIPTAHTTALFGFIFYLWLGVQLHKYFDKFNQIIGKIKKYQLVVITLACLVLNISEGIFLMNLGSEDPFNTLKITTIIYSLSAFLLLYKIADFKLIDKLNPRSTTFGIYLIHQIIVFHLLQIIFKLLHINYNDSSSITVLLLQIFRFLVVYSLTYTIVSLILRKGGRLKWIIGQ